MLKLRIALCMALVVGTLTLINGIIYSARMVTIIYRVVISVVFFGLAGYSISVLFENYFKKILIKKTAQSQDADIVSEKKDLDGQPNESGFSPFTSDNFQQISRPKE